MGKVNRYELLPLSELGIDRFQVRKQNVGQGLDELAASIEKWGLIQPITVCKWQGDPGPYKWEIVCGQRRFLAHQQLSRDEIYCGIIEGDIELEEGLALSASENVVRLNLTNKDMIDLCVTLYNRYGTFKDVAEETKLPYDIVRKYIKYDGLPEFLKEKVKNKELQTQEAMKVQDAATTSNVFDEGRATELIEVFKPQDNKTRAKILELAKKHPDATAEQIVKEAEKPDTTTKLGLTFDGDQSNALQSFADDEESSTKEAAHGLILEGLGIKGYLEDDD